MRVPNGWWMVMVCAACGPPAKTPDAGAGAVDHDTLVDDSASPAGGAEPATTGEEASAPPSPAEVKSLVNAIARGAQAAFEREGAPEEVTGKGPAKVVHALCLSASPVPADVPKATRYTPNDSDFEGTDPKVGWSCLKFAATDPFPCQLTYFAGRGYKSIARGNKALKEDPPGKKPTGFEAAAECDFDGDGETSLYARTATIDPKFQQLGTTQEFADKEGE